MNNIEDVSVVDLFFAIKRFFGSSLTNFDEGMGFLCTTIAERLDVQLRTEVTNVEESGRGVRVSWRLDDEPEVTEDADACVIALSAHQMLDVHAGLPAQARELIRSLSYADLMSVQIALARPPDESAAVVSLPRSEHPDLCTMTFDHNKAPGRAPAGKGLLNTYWDPNWVTRQWHADDAQVGRDAVAGVSKLYPAVESDVEWTRVHRFKPGVLVTKPGTYTALRRFHRSYDPRSRIQIAGDYVGGSTTNSALCSGERAARLIDRQAAAFS